MRRSGDRLQVFKKTLPGEWGYVPHFDQRWKPRPATPAEYLHRLTLFNRVFGSGIKLEGVLETSKGNGPGGAPPGGSVGIIHSQPFHEALDPHDPDPSVKEVDAFMRSEGFEPAGNLTWIRPSDGIVVLDAKTENFIQTAGGVVPVDLIVGQDSRGGGGRPESARRGPESGGPAGSGETPPPETVPSPPDAAPAKTPAADSRRKPPVARWDNPKSIPTFGHAFIRHGKKIKAQSLADRAAADGVQIGQFLDEKAAAAHIASIAQTRGQGVHDIPLPPGLRTRVMLPTRVEVPADMMRVVVNADGLATTAFPYNSQHPTQ